jgi:multicomponent Na+:H+ antiporter subunit D
MTIAEHLPALQIALPLISAPLCALMPRPRLAYGFAVLVSWTTFGIALALLTQVLQAGPLVYVMGGWEPPWGIVYVIDPLNALILALVSGMAAVIMPSADLGISVEVTARARRLFFSIALLALTGMLGIVITGDVFNLYVFLEISSLASYALIATGSDRRALPAAFNYLVQGTIGATFIVIGIGLVYIMTGSLNMADLSVRLADLRDSAPVQAAVAFVLVGSAIKFALFPAHAWMPNAYAYAPSLVSAFFGATATKVGAYVMVRFIFSVFGASFVLEQMAVGWVLIVLGLAAAFVGSLVAIWQNDLKRMLAYSSVAQIGYIAAAIGIGNREGIIAAIVHVFNHGLMKGALFLVMACVILRLGRANIANFRGLGRRMPVTMACFVVAGLSMIGVPLTVGFISKWYLVLGALEADIWPVAALVVASSLLSAVYVWRIVEAAYFERAADPAPVREAPAQLLVPTVVLTILCVALGISTEATVDIAARAVTYLGVLR